MSVGEQFARCCVLRWICGAPGYGKRRSCDLRGERSLAVLREEPNKNMVISLRCSLLAAGLSSRFPSLDLRALNIPLQVGKQARSIQQASVRGLLVLL
jgi:hypothetical protein